MPFHSFEILCLFFKRGLTGLLISKNRLNAAITALLRLLLYQISKDATHLSHEIREDIINETNNGFTLINIYKP